MGSITYTRKRNWAKIGFVRHLTGFDHEEMRNLREQKLIEWEEKDGVFWYDIDTIPERFLIRK
jgi:hypothetical protein